MKHSPEPWKFYNNNILAANNQSCLQKNADAERIIACVNACQGVPSEELKSLIWCGIDKLLDLYVDIKQPLPGWLESYKEAYGCSGDL